MTKHCDTKAAPTFAAEDQFTPVLAGGEVVRYRLEAGEVSGI